MCENSGLLAVLMLLPEPSLISNPGSKAGLPLEPDFLLGRDGAVDSVKEALPGAGPFRSGFTFSFSADAGEECNTFNITELLITQVQKNMT